MLYDVFVSRILLASFTFTKSNIKNVSECPSTGNLLFGKFQLYNSVLLVEQIYSGESRNQRQDKRMDIQYYQEIQIG